MKKIVIITGAAGNLGRAAVEKFIDAGYYVIATVEPNSKAAPLENRLRLETHTVDVTSEADVEQFVRKIAAYTDSTIEASVMLVGGFAAGSIEQTGQEQLQKMIQLNFESAYFMARQVYQQMLKQDNGGQLIFIGARPALESQEGKDYMAYALSKSLLFKLAELLNAEGKKKHIFSSVLVPSTIDTPRNRQSNPDADFRTWVRPEEVAESMAFVCSPAGRKIQDVVLKVYGAA
ncbi:SDR family NAD(P)-dependent oxidoreductase [Nibrella viscosa]|uniref:SDR family NAD(P)-dependent oxidoreductase n=1 Tax=Nibrella viscosa TaxID=1084524 RepID=A0ABP8KTP1_9BACT